MNISNALNEADNVSLDLEKDIPELVKETMSVLENAGYEAYIVGGCVRDILMSRTPKDWDITTNASPAQISVLYPKTVVEEKFGTVSVIHETVSDEILKVIQITPFRKESLYIDGRHPENVTFVSNIAEDLSRRDFTINALAYRNGQLIDLFHGKQDIDSKLIKSVGNPDERFNEDGLRILRAIRFSCQLGFMINMDVYDSILNNKAILDKISRERIRDEFLKIIMSSNPSQGLFIMQKLRITHIISPILEHSEGVKQNQAHSFDVFEHLNRSLQCAADKNYPLHVRLAALFHDIGKPKTAIFSRENKDWTFYGHEVVGARITEKILNDLRLPKDLIEKVVKLIRWHMFFSDTETITLSAVRRLIVNVGKDMIWDLMDVRVCDRVGTGRPKENPYRLRKYRSMIEEALRDPISLAMLKINGNDLIKEAGIAAGPKIGFILQALFNDVIEDPKVNTKESLLDKALILKDLDITELKKMGEKGRETMANIENEEINRIKDKHHVK